MPLVRFISRNGPNAYAKPDVRFIKSVVPDFQEAMQQQARIEKDLQAENPDLSAVIYRVARDGLKLYLRRQLLNTDGNVRTSLDPETGKPEPETAKRIGYLIVGTPTDLKHADDVLKDDPQLSAAVRDICTNFTHKGKPDPAGPN